MENQISIFLKSCKLLYLVLATSKNTTEEFSFVSEAKRACLYAHKIMIIMPAIMKVHNVGSPFVQERDKE